MSSMAFTNGISVKPVYYDIVLAEYANGMFGEPVHFSSRPQHQRSLSCVCKLCPYIFVLAHKPLTHAQNFYCFYVTLNCYNGCACIFLFSTNTHMVCWLLLYIFVLVNRLDSQNLYIVSV
jgi:hypothetical protein